MRKHHALWEARSTTGVLHIADIVAADILLGLIELLILDILSQQQQLSRIKHTTIFLHTYIYYVLEVGEALAVEVSALTGLQLRQHRVGHVHIVTVPCTVGDTERVHVRVLAEIFQFILLVVGVHGDKHRTNLGGSIEEREPVGHVGGPDTDIATFGDTDGQESLGQVIHALIELFPCEAQVAVRIDDIFLIGRDLCPMFKPLTEGALIERITFATRLCRI